MRKVKLKSIDPSYLIIVSLYNKLLRASRPSQYEKRQLRNSMHITKAVNDFLFEVRNRRPPLQHRQLPELIRLQDVSHYLGPAVVQVQESMNATGYDGLPQVSGQHYVILLGRVNRPGRQGLGVFARPALLLGGFDHLLLRPSLHDLLGH